MICFDIFNVPFSRFFFNFATTFLRFMLSLKIYAKHEEDFSKKGIKKCVHISVF